MTDDLVARLREADEWMLVGLEGLAFHSDAPFDAADEIGRLRAELAAERERAEAHFLAAQEADDELATIRAERDALRAELAAERERVAAYQAHIIRCDNSLKQYHAERDALRKLLRYASGYLLVADAPVDDLLARIDAALKGDEDGNR